MQCVRDRYPAFVSPAKDTMQLCMWQMCPARAGVPWHTPSWRVFMYMCLYHRAFDDAPNDASTSSSSALAAG